ncbi:MAG: hypothetical protein JRG91_15985 [Deltaproteobacteria bacterium]|nr:hypothetical protein [Deltaproteobacteria bacterium]
MTNQTSSVPSPTGRTSLPRWAVTSAFAIIVATQVFFSFLGISEQWVRGHNGWNNAAYHQSARNTLRWNVLFPI